MKGFAFVDGPAAVAKARECAPELALVTDNPFLAADPAFDGAIENIDRLISQADAFALGRAAVDLTHEIDERLHAAGFDRDEYLVPGHLQIARSTTRILSTLTYRATLMARALARHRPRRVLLAVADQPRFDPLHPLYLPYFASPYRPLAEEGFFGKRKLTVEPVRVTVPDTINETASDSLATRLALLPVPVIVREVLARAGLRWPGRRARVIVLGGAENIRETLPWLALRGFDIRQVGKLGLSRVGQLDYSAGEAPVGFETRPKLDRDLAAALLPWLTDRVTSLGELNRTQSRAVTMTFLYHLDAGLAQLRHQVGGFRRRLEDALGDAPRGASLVLTSALIGATGAQIYGLCRELGVTVVDFEHGVTTGLAARSQYVIATSEASNCDVLLAYSDRARRSFEAARPTHPPVVRVIGAPSQSKRILRRPLQRWLARRRLPEVPSGRPLIMHVSTFLAAGNMRFGFDGPAESHIFEIDRTLIEQVYGKLRAPVIFKHYPAQRFLHQPSYETILPAAANVRYVGDEDFRYIRAAADLIVTASPTSTLGWCVGTGVPLVYLGSRIMNTLAGDDLEAAFRDGFFYIDLDETGWAESLRELLSRPFGDIRAEWARKKPQRDALCREAITGPRGSAGRQAARIVAELCATPAPPAGAVVPGADRKAG